MGDRVWGRGLIASFSQETQQVGKPKDPSEKHGIVGKVQKSKRRPPLPGPLALCGLPGAEVHRLEPTLILGQEVPSVFLPCHLPTLPPHTHTHTHPSKIFGLRTYKG